ncbi:PhnD/SsuA/transferrin family substrate-binding protein [Neiella sp. HB171785]|uniref:PhnD/SsuA/transferrin family substrate-binding protein n=1 Tax=Neiella litorisoli TaxID=2771431 RepID=A0A8J6QEG8_9GAMM|nr:phosphate/phosphite/phosphonate ABC transporter substrate-binding protein [Neiella litorisoli]MBD1388074.1 PhnD/SsuA/transferrin family substrate-binding protein [Neiella litorisoli]
MNTSGFCRYFSATTLLLAALAGSLPSAAAEELVRIGVIAKRGYEITLMRWQPMADYLTGQIPGYEFEVLPLDFDQVRQAVASGNVQFVLVNASIYVQLEQDYGVSRIATLKNQKSGKVFSTFGSVIFSDNRKLQLKKVKQLRNKRIAAVDKASLGGWHMALKVMMDHGIDPEHDVQSVQFKGTHDRVVQAVLAGEADVGIVRTDHLEQMASEGHIDLSVISALPPPSESLNEFPFLLSTELYPEWPFSRVAFTSDELAEKVAAALITMPQNGAATAANIAGWTVPYHYKPVRNLLRQLQLPPYDKAKEVDLSQVAKQYSMTIIAAVLTLLLLAGLLVRQRLLTQQLRQSEQRLKAFSHRLNLATQAGNFGVWEWHRNHKELIWNQQMYQLFEIETDTTEPLDKQWLAKVHPDDQQMVMDHLIEPRLAGEQFNCEFRIVLASGKERMIRSACVIAPATENQDAYMVGVSWEPRTFSNLETP